MMETREKQKEMELRAIVLVLLLAEARKTRDCGKQDPHVISSIPVHIAAPSNNHYNEAMIQIRLPNGQAVKQTFGAMEPVVNYKVLMKSRYKYINMHLIILINPFFFQNHSETAVNFNIIFISFISTSLFIAFGDGSYYARVSTAVFKIYFPSYRLVKILLINKLFL
uniref:UBX domain-containing protein n=1 Tax=Heterorhabditis bacteriophora TaxID=37862 RepID=A0A1I7WCE5_HETBA